MATSTNEEDVGVSHRRFGRGVLADLAFAVLLLAVLWVVYAPYLEHTPRADQWCFLVDTIDQHDFLDIFQHSYSYNRTRRVMPGDTDWQYVRSDGVLELEARYSIKASDGSRPGTPGAGVTMTRSWVMSSIRKLVAPSAKMSPTRDS